MTSEKVADLDRTAGGGAPTQEIAVSSGAAAAIMRGKHSSAVGPRFGMTCGRADRRTRSFALLGTAGLARTAPDDDPSVLKARPLERCLATGPPPGTMSAGECPSWPAGWESASGLPSERPTRKGTASNLTLSKR
ncbi:MAG: hypothetical protein LBT40_06415 [Deltaproteobacteria bacterium]|nr:hypothetical protein [Deltaproteobacteria bacterium]